jgi:hypothetical protein
MEKAGYQIRDQSMPHFMTFTVVDWGGPTIRDIFTHKIYRYIVIESMKFCQKQKGLILHGYVKMRRAALSNHIHVIFQAETGDLSDLVRDFKVFTAKEILKPAVRRYGQHSMSITTSNHSELSNPNSVPLAMTKFAKSMAALRWLYHRWGLIQVLLAISPIINILSPIIFNWTNNWIIH